MKSVNFNEHIKKRKDFKRIRLEKGLNRLPRTKPKDKEEMEVSHRLIEARRRRWILEGKLEKIGFRAWRIG